MCFLPYKYMLLFFCRGGKYTEDDAKAVLIQILNVVAFCHLHGVVHRDLKPEVENILFISLPLGFINSDGFTFPKNRTKKKVVLRGGPPLDTDGCFDVIVSCKSLFPLPPLSQTTVDFKIFREQGESEELECTQCWQPAIFKGVKVIEVP